VDVAGNVTYTPNPNLNGGDQFTYTVADLFGRISNIATVAVTINPVNDAPVALADAYQVTEGNILNVAAPGVLVNDSDIDSATLTTTGATSGAIGSVIMNSDGSFSYTPAAGSGGSIDTFTYTVTDGLQTATASVTITIVAPPPPANNQPPEAQDDKLNYSRRAYSNGPMTFDINTLLANDTDPDDPAFPTGATVQLVGGTSRSDSSIVNNGDGTLTYTPPASGSSDEFTYLAIDAQGGVSNSAKVTVRIRR
jgi:VCBS repeat-containing protein